MSKCNVLLTLPLWLDRNSILKSIINSSIFHLDKVSCVNNDKEKLDSQISTYKDMDAYNEFTQWISDQHQSVKCQKI